MANTYDSYMNSTYTGAALLREHSLDTLGLWNIKGEDPNCDMGGVHRQANLGIVRGRLDDVIKYAVELDGFWSWGSGGNIVLIPEPKTITPDFIKQRKAAEAKISSLQTQLAEAIKELEDLK